jgi:hypothetical protein
MYTPNTKPAFEIKAVPNYKTTQRMCTVDKKTGRIVHKEVEVKGGWMVFFPQGHSIHVNDENELKRLQFHEDPDLVDMQEGIVFRKGDIRNGMNQSLEALVARSTKQTRGEVLADMGEGGNND